MKAVFNSAQSSTFVLNKQKMKFKTVFLLLTVIACFKTYGQTETAQSLDSIVIKKRAFNKIAKQGYRIQLYNGDEEKALQVMENFMNDFPEIEIKRIYKAPEWKIQTTTYKTRIAADRVLNIIREEYPSARVL